ncbi:hypothetical protein [Clostridium thermobutyricum]|uniref:hypothetical protein n=1 Tax=Clostridium thermobutyricum TaxID=29372 RepID=UPI003F51E5FE
MFIVYSKQNGKIKTVASGNNYKSIKDLFPAEYEDYELIYDCLNTDDDPLILNNPSMFVIKDRNVVLNKNLNKYQE